jgi:vacuolar-type H+-ATPase subunit E/Vma4
MQIENLKFPILIYNSLKRHGIDTVEELLKMSDDDILKIRNINQRRYQEIKDTIRNIKGSNINTKKKMTNYERIQNMSIDELAEFLIGDRNDIESYEEVLELSVTHYLDLNYTETTNTSVKDMVKTWLKKEVSEKENKNDKKQI